jgi:hypothetical protein
VHQKKEHKKKVNVSPEVSRESCSLNANEMREKKQDGGGVLSPGVEQGLTVSLAGGQASWEARVQPFLKGT